MAKLSARGQKEVVRVQTEVRDEVDKSTRRITRALMDNGKILQKVDWQKDGEPRHAGGWTVRGRLKAGAIAQDFRDLYEGRGWTVVPK